LTQVGSGQQCTELGGEKGHCCPLHEQSYEPQLATADATTDITCLHPTVESHEPILGATADATAGYTCLLHELPKGTNAVAGATAGHHCLRRMPSHTHTCSASNCRRMLATASRTSHRPECTNHMHMRLAEHPHGCHRARTPTNVRGAGHMRTSGRRLCKQLTHP
jgi:hypothetical protein